MTTTITRARTTAAAAVSSSASRTTDLLKVKVSENDPKLKASATAFGVKVSGTATNNGIVASSMELGFDGKKVSLQLSKGDGAAQVFKKLKAALPEGYQARMLDGVSFGISKVASGPKFPGTIKGAGWSPGSGIATPGGGGARMGLYVDAQVNPLTTVGAKVKLDIASKTLFITMSGKTGKPNQAADTQKRVDVGFPNGMQMGTKYKLVVQDASGHKLFGTTVTPFPAA